MKTEKIGEEKDAGSHMGGRRNLLLDAEIREEGVRQKIQKRTKSKLGPNDAALVGLQDKARR